MLALPNLQASLDALELLRQMSFPGEITAMARYLDEEKVLRKSGKTAVFNICTEAGAGFADHIEVNMKH